MRLLNIAALFLGTVAATVPTTLESHQLCLPYVPQSSPNSRSQIDGESYLLIDWSIQNGIVYANNDQIFPSSISTELHAPRHNIADMDTIDKDVLQLSYALNIRPLPTKNTATDGKMVRMRLEPLDLDGESVSSYAAVLDLFRSSTWEYRIMNVGVEPNSQYHLLPEPRPWQMKYWQVQLDSFSFKGVQRGPVDLSTQTSRLQSRATSREDDASKTNADVFEVLPFWDASSSNQPTNSEPSHGFLAEIRPYILPASIGVLVGILACFIGFMIGYFAMYLLTRCGPWKRSIRRSWVSKTKRARYALMEPLIVPETYVDAEEV